MNKLIKNFVLLTGALVVISCGSGALKYEKAGELKKIDEFDNKVQIVIPVDPDDEPAGTTAAEKEKAEAVKTSVAETPAVKKVEKIAPAPKAAKVKKQKTVKLPPLPKRRPPELESDAGFAPPRFTADGQLSRRPLADPFRVGEKVVHKVNYYALSAGSMNVEVKPFAEVNGRKSYHFHIGIRTSDWYSRIYSVDDKVSVLMDFESLVPSVFTLAVRESGQLKEARMLFEKNTATYWERRVTEKNGEEEKRLNWEILDYSQNLFSSVFYMRFFDWKVGVENSFRVADDNENLIFRAKAIRKEKISTDAGEFNAIVIQPQVELKGKFKPVGDIFIWLSDDDRKYILKIESKVKIGTLVSEITELVPGKNP